MALDLNDKTTNGFNLTNSNATDYTTDSPFAAVTHSAALVRATPAFLYVADAAGLEPATALTIECWVKFDTVISVNGDINTFVAKNENVGSEREFMFYLSSDGTNTYLLLALTTVGTGYDDYFSVQWNPSTDTWYHIAVSWTGSTKTAQFTVNGVQQGADQVGTITSIRNGTARVSIGARNTANTPMDGHSGKITQVRYWKVARTITQILNNYNLFIAADSTNMMAYWPFEPVPPPVIPNKSYLYNQAIHRSNYF